MKIVLTIAGSDSGAGAGIQADLKTFAACGVYGTSCITSVTAQNSKGVTLIRNLDSEIIKAQIEAVLSDFDIKYIKIGMIGNLKAAKAIVEILAKFKAKKSLFVVYDPVMVSETNATLMEANIIEYIKLNLLPIVDVVTPNLWEASKLLKEMISDPAGMEKAAKKITIFGVKHVIVKGGHLTKSALDVCYSTTNNQMFRVEKSLLKTNATHGTGCSFSSALTAFLAKGLTFKAAVEAAKEYVFNGIKYGIKITENGKSPINHFWNNKE